MAEGGDEDKTEEPTDKKLREAREKGQVTHSRELNTWVMLSTGAVLLASTSYWLASSLTEILRGFIISPHAYVMDGGAIAQLMSSTIVKVAKILAIPMLVFFVAAFLSSFLQIGPL